MPNRPPKEQSVRELYLKQQEHRAAITPDMYYNDKRLEEIMKVRQCQQ